MRDRARKQSKSRLGMTIIELVVAMGIVGLLMAILIPGVQQVRHSSRRLQCQSHLRQVGLALANVVEATGAFPTASLPHSGYLRLLPSLDAGPIFEAVTSNELPDSWMVPVFGCPEDPVVWENMVGGGETSYYFNNGTSFLSSPSSNGFIRRATRDTRPNDITDGLSNTVAMSERLVRPWLNQPSSEGMKRQPERYFWWTEFRFRNAEEAIDNCRNHRTTVFPQTFGINMVNYRSNSNYNHLLTPNQPGCYNNIEDFEVDFELSLIPASSLHHGGVNSLMGDGSVHFFNESISEEVWHALGTRNGSETVTF